MYTLYHLPGSCSLATLTVLHELGLPVDTINVQNTQEFRSINPVGTVPVLKQGHTIYTEGAAVLLHLFENHKNTLMPTSAKEKELAIKNIMFANATMHPAYSKLFFIAKTEIAEDAKNIAFQSAADAISHLWDTVESQLIDQPYLGGNNISPADIMLTVYSLWGEYFPVDIHIGKHTQAMIDHVKGTPSFQAALRDEKNQVAV